MLDFTTFREQVTHQEDIDDLVEKYNITHKIAKSVKEELSKRNIDNDAETVSSIIRMLKLKEEPKSKKQLRAEEKQGNLNYLLKQFKEDKKKKQNIDETFKSIFNVGVK
jgi:hypothetical protein